MAQIIRIKYDIDDKDVEQAQKEFKKTAKAAGATDKEIEQINKEIKKMPANAKKAQKGVSGLGGGIKKLGGAIAAAFAVQQVVQFGKAAVAAADIQIKAEQKVANTIKSTGGAAGRTLDQLKTAASELQGTSLFGDEDILTNVTASLLTFTNIAEEQFDKAQQAAVNLSAQFGTDLQSSALQLGKALNDPVAGLSALSRSGVSFSKEQKNVVKSLVETGQSAKAQELILKELEVQFGGAAEAAARAGLGPFQQFQMMLGDLTEEVGKKLIPVLNFIPKVFNKWLELGAPIADFVGGIFSGISELGRVISVAITEIFGLSESFSIGGAILQGYQVVMDAFWGTLKFIFVPLLDVASGAVKVFAGTFSGLKAVLKEVAMDFGNFGDALGQIFKGNFSAGAAQLKATFTDFGSDIGDAFNNAYGETIEKFTKDELPEALTPPIPAIKKVGEDAGKTLGAGIKKALRAPIAEAFKIGGNEADFDELVKSADMAGIKIDEANRARRAKDAEDRKKILDDLIQKEKDGIASAAVERRRIEAEEAARKKQEAIDKKQDEVNAQLELGAALVSSGLQVSQAIADGELKILEEKRAAELKAAEGNAKAQQVINEKFDKQKERIQKRDFQRQKALNLAMAAINTAQSILAITTVPDFTLGVASAARIAAVVAAGLTQAGVIASAKFADGVINLQGPGTGTSDSIPARLSKGESVMTAKETAQFMPTLKAIRSNKVSPEVLNNLVLGKNGVSVINNNTTAGATAPTPIINVDEYGISRYNRQAGDTHDRLNRKMDL